MTNTATFLTRHLFYSAAIIALAAPALAQDGPAVPPADPAPATAEAADPSAEATAAGTQGDGPNDGAIVITAQKREERLQDVPISISVVSGEQMVESGASQLSDYAAYVPGLQVDNAGSPGRSTLSLRGVAPIGPSATVGIYLDDAPVGSSGIYNRGQVFTLDLMPYDIQRLEVLRGPQGTLYGASSIGGLLKYVTVQPDLNDISGRAGAELFDIAHGGGLGWSVNARINVPLVEDALAVSGSFSRRRTPGYIDNILSGEEDVNDAVQEGGRAALLWRPAPEVTIKLSALLQTVDSDDIGVIYEGPDNTPLAPGARFLSTNALLGQPFKSKFQVYSAGLAYDFGFAEISSTTSYSSLDVDETSDASRVFGPIWGGLAIFPADLTQKKWTQEIRLTSPSGNRLEWLVGFFYTNEDNTHDQIVHPLDNSGAVIDALDPFAIVALPNKYKEYAVFGNATYKFTEQLHLTGGLRWAENKQKFNQVTQIPLIGLDIGGPGESKEDVLTYSISPQFHFNRNAMVYARVATGYRPGGPNVALPGFPATVGAETVTSYEAGVKTILAGGAVNFDAAAFYLDWNDLQVGQAFANGINGLVNAGTARSKGFEAAVTTYPIEGLTLGANFAYADAECTETTPNCTKGDRLPNVPKASGALFSNYDFALGARADANVGGVLRVVGDRISAVESSPDSIPVKGYTTVDLNASVTFDRRWTVRGYVRNLFDAKGRLTSDSAVTNPGFISTTPLQPRTIGIAAEAQF